MVFFGVFLSWTGGQRAPLQKLVLPKVHPLNDVSAIIEHPSNVFCVYCACKVRVTVVLAISTGRADPLENGHEESQQ